MAEASPIQTSLNGGIFSPLLDGHIDAPRRDTSYSDSANLIALKQGPLARRGGTVRVFEEKRLSTGRTHLIPFIFSDEQAYVLVFTNAQMRVYKDGDVVFQAAVEQTVTGISEASPPVVTVADATGYGTGRFVRLTGLSEAVNLNNREFRSENATGTTFELFEVDETTAIGVPKDANGDDTAETSSTGTSEAVFTLTLPYDEDDLFDSSNVFIPHVVQSNDVLYVVQPNFTPRVLARTADDAWTIAKLQFNNGPFQTQNFSDTEFVITAGASARIWDVVTSVTDVVRPSDTLDAGSGGDANDLGTATESNRLIRIQNAADEWRWGRITKYFDGLHFEFTIDADAKNTDAVAGGTTEWALGAYSDTTGYPSVISIHEGRIVPGAPGPGVVSGTGEPRRIDFSAIAGFSPTAVDFIPSDEDGIVRPDDGFTVTIGGGNVNPVAWIESISEGLAVGTIASEGLIRSSKNSESLTPENASYKKSSTAGSYGIQPIAVKNALLHVQFARRRLQELVFSFNRDGFQSFDMTELAEHLTREKIIEIAYAQQPIETIWTLLGDGSLIGFTYERNADVLGWHRHVIGGTDVDINSIAVIPSKDLSRDELWMTVTRTISGQTPTTRTYIARMGRHYEDDIIQEHAFHQDSGTIYRATEIAITQISQTDPVLITAPAHFLDNGDKAYIRGVEGMTQVNGNTYEFANVTATTAELKDPATSEDINGTGFDAYVSGGTLQESVGTFRALNYLEGEEVEIYVDGRTHVNKTVTNGLIELDDGRTGANVSIGLPTEWTFKSHRFETGSQLTSSQGKIRRISQVIVRLLSTLGLQYGPDLDNLDEEPFDYGTDVNSMTPLFTGDKQFNWPGGYEIEGRIVMKGTGPFPAQIQSIVPQIETAQRAR